MLRQAFITPIGLFLFFVLPSSTNYKLDSLGFGGGGLGNGTSSNYSINAISGEVSAGSLSGTSYDLGSGLSFVQQA